MFFFSKLNFGFQNFGDRENGRVVMYITTLSILRETWARCVKVRQILRNLLIKVDERDVFMSRENQTELMERMGTEYGLQLPQVFVDGQHLGVKLLLTLPIYFTATLFTTQFLYTWLIKAWLTMQLKPEKFLNFSPLNLSCYTTLSVLT